MTRRKDDPRLRLIISGSDVSFFEQEVVGYAATSYGRRTGSIHVQPFAWPEIAPFVPDWPVDDRVRTWAIWGGMPYYLDEIDPEQSLADNIWRTILVPGGLLRDEPTFLLARRDFSPRLREIARERGADRVRLVDLDDLAH